MHDLLLSIVIAGEFSEVRGAPPTPELKHFDFHLIESSSVVDPPGRKDRRKPSAAHWASAGLPA